jgi:epsin
LQLLEYLIKNGAERVIDNAREHQYEIKALKNFHFVTEKGKDEGINGWLSNAELILKVRHRAQEIADLLNDTDRIKDERKRAKENRGKYKGVSADQMKYQGFGNKSGGFGSDFNRSESNRSDNYGRSDSYRSNSPENKGGFHDEPNSDEESKVAYVQKPTKQTEKTEKKTVDLLDLDDFAPAPVGKDSEWSDFSGEKQEDDEFGGFQSPSAGKDDWADFASFESAPAPATPPVQPSQPSQKSQISFGGSFAAALPPVQSKPASNDPFAKLVSLDAASLASFQPKKDTHNVGPKMNTISVVPTPSQKPPMGVKSPSSAGSKTQLEFDGSLI